MQKNNRTPNICENDERSEWKCLDLLQDQSLIIDYWQRGLRARMQMDTTVLLVTQATRRRDLSLGEGARLCRGGDISSVFMCVTAALFGGQGSSRCVGSADNILRCCLQRHQCSHRSSCGTSEFALKQLEHINIRTGAVAERSIWHWNSRRTSKFGLGQLENIKVHQSLPDCAMSTRDIHIFPHFTMTRYQTFISLI
jgi:hypothetical protein